AEESYREAREAIKLRDEFLRVASHELRTPLASLLPSLQTLQRHCAKVTIDRAILAKQIDINMRQGARLRRLVEDLFDTTNIVSGQLALQLSAIDLTELVREVVGRFALQLRRAHCRLQLEAPLAVCGVWDGSRLDQVVSNLLDNAIKFGPERPIEITI